MRAPLAVMMLDLDGLKLINDTHGHPVGAHTIAEVGKIIGTASSRSTAPPAASAATSSPRSCPGSASATALKVGETIRALVAGHRFEKDGVVVRPTISIGVAAFPEDGADGRAALAPRRRGALPRQEDRPRPRAHMSPRRRPPSTTRSGRTCT